MPLRPSLGHLTLALEPGPYRPGEPVRGTVKVELSSATSARRLVVSLVARERAVGRQSLLGGLQLAFRNDKVFELQVELDGPRRYQPGEAHRFELLVPTAPFAPSEEQTRELSRLTEVKRFALAWSVSAFLDRPWHLSPRAELPVTLELTSTTTAPPAPTPRPRPKRKSKSKRASRAKKPKR